MPESSSFLQGSYVYLLIAQVVLVTGLMLSALWLIVRRLKTEQEGVFDGPGPQSFTQVVPGGDPELEDLSRRQTEKIATLERELEGLERSTSELREGSDKSNKLREKIRYLEQKLLEYEILQEEISTLSHLKQENDRLRDQLTHAGLQVDVDEAVAGNEEVTPDEVRFVEPEGDEAVATETDSDTDNDTDTEASTLELTPEEEQTSESPSDDLDDAPTPPPVRHVDGGAVPNEDLVDLPELASSRSESNPFLKPDAPPASEEAEEKAGARKMREDLKTAGSDQEVEFILSQLDELEKK